jgi:hypothetical protein
VLRAGGRLRVEAGLGEQAEPGAAAERPEPMRLAHDLNGAVRIAQHELVLGLDPVVGRIRIPRPFGETGLAAGRVTAAATAAGRVERLRGVIGHEHRDAAGTAMRERRLDHLAEVAFAGHVVDGVMDEDRVEHPAQPDHPHVTLKVRALGVEFARHGQHLLGEVDERQVHPALQTRGDVAAATAQIQHLAHRNRRRTEHRGQVRGLFRVLPQRRDQRPPAGQIPVQAVLARRAGHASHPCSPPAWDVTASHRASAR